MFFIFLFSRNKSFPSHTGYIKKSELSPFRYLKIKIIARNRPNWLKIAFFTL
jgi:hypothetical protein